MQKNKNLGGSSRGGRGDLSPPPPFAYTSNSSFHGARGGKRGESVIFQVPMIKEFHYDKRNICKYLY